jgi:hypothetical protein
MTIPQRLSDYRTYEGLESCGGSVIGGGISNGTARARGFAVTTAVAGLFAAPWVAMLSDTTESEPTLSPTPSPSITPQPSSTPNPDKKYYIAIAYGIRGPVPVSPPLTAKEAYSVLHTINAAAWQTTLLRVIIAISKTMCMVYILYPNKMPEI